MVAEAVNFAECRQHKFLSHCLKQERTSFTDLSIRDTQQNFEERNKAFAQKRMHLKNGGFWEKPLEMSSRGTALYVSRLHSQWF